MPDPERAAPVAGPVLERAAAGLRALGPWPPGERCALAFSGGADSVFLAAALRRFMPGAGGMPAWVVDHGHRPGTAEEARRAAARAGRHGFRAEVLVAATAGTAEDDLRRARYAAFAAAARSRGVEVLLTAHQADDRAETVLLRILRGTGLRGLAGIPPRREILSPGGRLEVRRPLLGIRRAEIRHALRELGLAWQEDPTNADPEAAARNRLRAVILPLLAKVATGDPVQAVLRLAGEAWEWNQALEELLDAAPDWRELPGHLRRQAVARQLRRLGATVSPARLRDLEGALRARGSAGVDGRWRLSTSGGRLAAIRRPEPPALKGTQAEPD